jgi:hypothetical protein
MDAPMFELLPEIGFEILARMTGYPRMIVCLANEELGYIIPGYDFNEKTYEITVFGLTKTLEAPRADTLKRDFSPNLTASITAGSTAMTVSDTTGMLPDDDIEVFGDIQSEEFKVVSVTSGTTARLNDVWGAGVGLAYAVGDGGTAVPDGPHPFAELEVGQKQQADEIEHQENDRGACGAKITEEVLVQIEADDAAGGGIEVACRQASSYSITYIEWQS